MAITLNRLHYLRVLLQIQQNLTNLQRDMRANAQTWKAMAAAQSPPVATLRQFMQDAAGAYERRLDWIQSFQARPEWTNVVALFQALGGNSSEVVAMFTELRAVENGLQGATLNNYTQITNACDQILATVDATLSLWPE